MDNANSWKLIDILNLSSNYLSEKKIENPRLNAELLIGHALNLKRVQLYLNYEKPLTETEVDAIRSLIKRRAKLEPLQYIIGETEFFALKFKVNRFTLIPRPETEILVEKIIETTKRVYQSPCSLKILDIGTGCGNIAISLAKHLPYVSIMAIDINQETLNVAKQNAVQHEVQHQIDFKNIDIFEKNFIQNYAGQFDLIVSNPPYISEQEIPGLPHEIKNHEPHSALIGGIDGMQFYQHILQISGYLLKSPGILGLEISYGKHNQLQDLFNQKSFITIEITKDLNNIERVIVGIK